MKKVWHLYVTDLRNIAKVPTGILLMIALAVLPSVYAWINLKAMWDPYGNTSGIKIAVTSLDEGAAVKDKPFNIGDDVLNSLKSNRQLGWTFVDQRTALHGVEHGDYYASLLIPADFSRKIVSLLSGTIQKPEIMYTVNEKINAVAPKITEKGASNVAMQISQQFIETISETLFAKMKELGIEFEKQLPTIRKVESRVFELEQRLPEIEAMGAKAVEIEQKLPELKAKGYKIIELEQRIPEIDRAGDAILKVESKWAAIDEAAKEIVAVQGKLPDIQRVSDKIVQLDQYFDQLQAAMNKAIDTTRQAVQKLSQLQPAAKSAKEALQGTGAAQPDVAGGLQDAQKAIAVIQAELDKLQQDLPQARARIHDAASAIQAKTKEFADALNAAVPFIRNDLPRVEQKLHQAADFVRNDLPAAEEEIRKAADLYRTKLPEVEQAVHGAADLARNDLPEFEAGVRKAADMFRKAEAENNLDQLYTLLQNDIRKESDFLASPVAIQENKLFPIPNYGSAMSPFYTTLSLWVGAMLLVSLLKVDVEDAEGVYRSHQVYFGRMLVFWTIGLCQAVIVTLGDIVLLGTFVAHKAWFVLFALLIGIVFVTITYTLVSVFGNIGKGLAIIFLVLQFSSSGGTFPVSTAASFFQWLNPFVPFTYAVGLMREAVGGILWDVVLVDVAFLLLFIAISFLFGLVLKKPLSRITRRMAESAERTKLIS